MVLTTLVVDLATHSWVITIQNKFVKINYELTIRVYETKNLQMTNKRLY